MFEKPGLFVWSAQNLPGSLPDEMKAGGFEWIALDLHDSLDLVEKADYKALIGRYRGLGLQVAGWGVLRGHPEEEANLAVDLCEKYDLHAYIANGERELGYTQESGPSGECFGRSDIWVQTFRKRTDMELGLSSYAIFADHDMHYSVWIDAGAVAMPQTYTNEFPWATPEAGMAGAIDVRQPQNPPNGWPRHRVYPTIGNYPMPNVPLPTAQEYAELLRKAQVVSFSIYLGELVHEGELQHFAGVCIAAPPVVPEPAPPKSEPAKPEPAPALQPLSTDDVPYTGPCYGPSDDRGPTASPTVAALKIAMRRLAVARIPDLDTYYSIELEDAMRLWQQKVGISPATGQYGRKSYDALLGALTKKGNHAFDERAIGLLQSDVEDVDVTEVKIPGG